MTEPGQQQTLTVREMALAKWVLELAARKFPEDDRAQMVALATASMVLSAADAEGNLPDTADEVAVRKFGLTIKQGCEARGGKRAEAAFACMAAAMAKVKDALGRSA